MQSMDTIGILVRVLMLVAIVISVSSVRCSRFKVHVEGSCTGRKKFVGNFNKSFTLAGLAVLQQHKLVLGYSQWLLLNFRGWGDKPCRELKYCLRTCTCILIKHFNTCRVRVVRLVTEPARPPTPQATRLGSEI